MSKLAVALGTNFPAGTIVTPAMMRDVRAIQADYAARVDGETWRCCACGQITRANGRLYKCRCDKPSK